MFWNKNIISRSNKNKKLFRLIAIIAAVLSISALVAFGWQKYDDKAASSGTENEYKLPDAFVEFARLINDMIQKGKEKLEEQKTTTEPSESASSEKGDNVVTIIVGSSSSESESGLEESSGEETKEIKGGIPEETEAEAIYSFKNAVFIGDYFVFAAKDYGYFQYSAFVPASDLDMNTIQTKKNFKLEDKYVIATDYLAALENVESVYITFSAESISWMDCPTFTKKFTSFIEAVQTSQPNAEIYIQSILPINSAKAEKREYTVTNEKIDEINRNLLAIAEEKNFWYLDINPLYKNEKGELAEEQTTNGIRLERASYDAWRDYITTHKAVK